MACRSTPPVYRKVFTGYDYRVKYWGRYERDFNLILLYKSLIVYTVQLIAVILGWVIYVSNIDGPKYPQPFCKGWNYTPVTTTKTSQSLR